jgi:hypothetical protein
MRLQGFAACAQIKIYAQWPTPLASGRAYARLFF